MYKCQIHSSSYLRYTPLNQSAHAHVIDTLFTHDTTWRHFWRRYFFPLLWWELILTFSESTITGFIMILLSCFILIFKKVTAHQQKVRFLTHPVHVILTYWLLMMSALSGDFVLLPPELPSFDEPGLCSDGGPSLFVVLQTFGTLFPQLSAPQTLTLLSGVR